MLRYQSRCLKLAKKKQGGDGGHRWILCLTPASVNLSSICVGRQERRAREGPGDVGAGAGGGGVGGSLC